MSTSTRPELDNKNWIYYYEASTGREIARQAAPKGSDFHCTMRFENEGPVIDIVNNRPFSGENALYMIHTETKEWVKITLPTLIKLLGAKS